MRKTFALVAVALASLAAAAVAALCRPLLARRPPPIQRGALRMTTQLDHAWVSESGGEAYLQVDLVAQGTPDRTRVPVNAVLILDRSGSMSGAKIDRARDAARALVQALGGDDRLAVVEFSSEASVLFPSSPMTAAARERALSAIEQLQPMGGTNMSLAFDLAAPELARGRAPGRVDKVFLASDGQANEGISDRAGLLRLAQRDFGGATLSTFGMGEDYDEDLMTAFAAQNGGRARYIASPEVLPGAFRDELSRAAAGVARHVELRIVSPALEKVLGYESEGGWVRLPDFAAGEERRVLAKLRIPAGAGLTSVASVELQFDDVASATRQHAEADAQVTRTADAALLGLPPTQAAAEGAKAELADIAQQAARAQELGRRAEAQVKLSALRDVAMREPSLQQVAGEYERDIGAIQGMGGAASKSVKQKAFDAVRAPVAGW